MFIPFANQNQFDPSAGAFINVTGIGGIEAVAVNNFVNQLKDATLWNKMTAIYPFVGGSANTNKYNLVNPQDTDAAFRLGFTGTWAHSPSGSQANGTTGYANTFMNASTQLNGSAAQNSAHSFMYMSSVTGRNGADMGVSVAAPAQAFNMNSRNASNLSGRACMTADVSTTVAYSGTAGAFGMSRTGSAGYVHFTDNAQTIVTQASATPPNLNIVLQAQNRGGVIQNFQNRLVKMFTLGVGLTSAEITNLVAINENFQRTLGRYP